VSGYIVLEEAVEDRTYVTWRDQVQQALNKVGIRLRSVVSDRAKALVKLALEGFTCPSTPDRFHALRDLAKVLGVSLHLKWKFQKQNAYFNLNINEISQL
jgi:hypothetical protein